MRHSVLWTLLLFGLMACNITRNLKNDTYLVKGVSVRTEVPLTTISQIELQQCLKIQPNRKWLFVFDFYPWWYSLFDETKIQEKKLKHTAKAIAYNNFHERFADSINQIRMTRGKPLKSAKKRDPNATLWIESFRDIGEPIAVYDKNQIAKTKTQLKKLLVSRGFLNAWISDSNYYNLKKRSVHVGFIVHPEKPYKINRWNYRFENPEDSLMALFKSDSIHSLLVKDQIFSATLLYSERERMTAFAKSKGYYFFENNFITFKADTLQMPPGEMNLEVCISGFKTSSDSLARSHMRLQWKHISVITPLTIDINGDYSHLSDSNQYRGISFRSHFTKPYKKQIILRELQFHPNTWYQPAQTETTYKRLIGTGIFQNVSIIIKPDTVSGQTALSASIVCIPPVKQIISAETEGTNTFGNLGIDANVVYRNRNLLKGGEVLEVKLQGAVSSQSQFNTKALDPTIEGLQNNFNTIQFGPEISLILPKAYGLFSWSKPLLRWNPRSYIKVNANIQTRPQFSRSIWSIDYGFNFKNEHGTIRHDFIPFELYSVKMGVFNDAFKDSLYRFNDAFLINSFQDHITTLMRYGISYSKYDYFINSNKTNFLFRWNVISSGSILRELFKLSNQATDSNGQYKLFSMPFAHFIKTDFDFRINIPFPKTNARLIWRISGGMGAPFKNLNVLPYEQSFFCGGPNSVRAWRSRTLGPGGYNPENSSMRFDKIGDILLESNLEFRFHMIRSFYGALFTDAGNVWRLYPDASKPNGEFDISRFYKQFAVGSGFGIRWDLDFFVLRLDLAVPLNDPKLWDTQSTWLFGKNPFRYTVTNFGIGYPF